MMDRAEAIKHFEYGISHDIFSEPVTSYARMAVDALREQEQSKWISVKERLPQSQEDVLVVAFWHECWQTMIGWHSDQGEKWRIITPHGEREPGSATHWMPLPEPLKEGTDNG